MLRPTIYIPSRLLPLQLPPLAAHGGAPSRERAPPPQPRRASRPRERAEQVEEPLPVA